MNGIKPNYVFLIWLLLLITGADAFAQSVYVSPQGKDTNPGTAKAPFASLAAAKNHVRLMRKKPVTGPVEIIIAPGTYYLSRPIEFTAEDSGTPSSPLIIRGESGAVPVFSGGTELPVFEKVSDRLWKVKIPDITKYGGAVQQLFVNGKRAIRARTPNEGTYFKIKDVSESLAANGAPANNSAAGQAKGMPAVQTISLTPAQFSVLPKNSPHFKDIIISINHAWDRTRKHLTGIAANPQAVTISGQPMKAWNKLNNSAQFYFENAREFMDAPGEFFVDTAGVLFYIPRKDEQIKNTSAVVPVIEQLLIIKGSPQQKVENITFKHLSFQFTNHLMPTLGEEPAQAAAPTEATVMIDYAGNIHFNGFEISHTGNNAIWFRAGCKNSEVTSSYLHDLGIGGIKIGEMKIPEGEERATGNITLDNNIIRSGGYEIPTGVGVMIFQSGDNTVSHNEIADFRYSGVSVGWVWGYSASPAKRNKIIFNHIHHLGWGALSDMGGVYTLGLSEGTVVSNNVIHDVYSYGYGGWGLYTDEGSTGITAENNLVYNCKSSGFHQHYGRDNVIRNNIFAFQVKAQLQATRVEDHNSFFFTHNIIYFNRGKLPENNWFKVTAVKDSNLYWDTRSKKVNTGNDKNAIVADPLFRDPLKYDFHFKSNKAISKISFKPFDYTKAGVYGKASWKKLAVFDPVLAVRFTKMVEQRLREDEPEIN